MSRASINSVRRLLLNEVEFLGGKIPDPSRSVRRLKGDGDLEGVILENGKMMRGGCVCGDLHGGGVRGGGGEGLENWGAFVRLPHLLQGQVMDLLLGFSYGQYADKFLDRV